MRTGGGRDGATGGRTRRGKMERLKKGKKGGKGDSIRVGDEGHGEGRLERKFIG